MKRLLFSVLICFAFFTAKPSHAQTIDPSQINWAADAGCGSTGTVYSPVAGQCVPVILASPAGNQSVSQPGGTALTINTVAFGTETSTNSNIQFINGIPQADQWCGGSTGVSCAADMCVKLRAANVYAIANGINQVDATHFYGTQSCSVDPFISLITPANYASIHLGVNLGAVHVQSAVEWNLNNSGLSLKGLGPQQTQVEYVGGSLVQAVIKVGTPGVLTFNTDVKGIFTYGGNANATYGFLSEDVSHSRFEDIYAWGATTCGVQTWGDVTDTFINDRTSNGDWATLGASGTHTAPPDGICTDADPATPFYQTTNSTFIDVAGEGVSGYAWHIENAQTLTFTSGTAENSGHGIYVSATNSKFNTFIGSDVEGNTANTTGVDVNDIGNLNTYINLLATSTCTSSPNSCVSSVLLAGSAGQMYLLGGYQPTGASGAGYNGFTPAFDATSATSGSATTLPSTPAGYMIQIVKGVTVKIPYYNN